MPAPEQLPQAGSALRALASLMRDSRVRYGVPLRELTTLRIGGAAAVVVDLESEADLNLLFEWSRVNGWPYFLLGKGSNLLADDGGYRGVVVRLGRGLSRLEADPGAATVKAGAGMANAAFVSGCRALGLGGMEFLVAIPGTIGGAIAMNAGAHDGETAQFLRSVRFYEASGAIHELPATAFKFAYRSSTLRGQQGRVVLSGEFSLRPMSQEDIRQREARFQAYRRETQPRDFPNCGSIFKNPPGEFAARLIEAAGLKGRQLGGAQVSEKHANFIVNRGDATGSEVLDLIDLIRKIVYQENGIRLELEMQVMGTGAE